MTDQPGFGSCTGCHETRWLAEGAQPLCVECISTDSVFDAIDPSSLELLVRVEPPVEPGQAVGSIRACIACGAERFMQVNHERCPGCYEQATARRGCCVNCGVDRPLVRGQGVCAECDVDPDAVRHLCEKCGATARKARNHALCKKCAQKSPGATLRHARYYFERRYRSGKISRKPGRGELVELARGLWDSLSTQRRNRLRQDLRDNNFNNSDPFEALVEYAQVTCWKSAAQLKNAEAKKRRPGQEEPKLRGSSVWTVSGGLPSLGKR